MKQPKKLTRNQKEILMNSGYNCKDYALVSESEFYLKVIHKTKGTIRMVSKYPSSKVRRK